jgi:hypothetical protein
VLIALFVFAIFARTMHFGLYLDDHHHARPWTLSEVLGTFRGPFDPLGIEPPYFRPLVVVTFAIDWALWGFNTWGYHLSNILLHSIAALCVYLFLRTVKMSWFAAFLGAIFFAIIPANAATAIYISERSDAMVTIFSLCGLLCLETYYRSKKVGWLITLNALVVLALCSKEIGVALPFLVISYWVYLVMLGTRPEGPITLTTLLGHVRSEARVLWQSLVGDGRWKKLFVVVGPSAALLICYMLYRSLVLPTGMIGLRYSESVSPLRGFASAIFWTFKAVPWEVPSRALPALAVAIGLALVLRPKSAGWLIVLLGVGWVAISCLPLAYLGQVEPRLLYMPEVGHAIVIAGLASILGDFVRSAYANNQRWQLLAVGLVLMVALTFFGATAFSHLQAQDQFQPNGYKMLQGDYEIYTDLRYRHLYPEYYIRQIEQKLRQAGQLP